MRGSRLDFLQCKFGLCRLDKQERSVQNRTVTRSVLMGFIAGFLQYFALDFPQNVFEFMRMDAERYMTVIKN